MLCGLDGLPDWVELGVADGDGVGPAEGLMLAEGDGSRVGQGPAGRPGLPGWP